jgi:hypothetical protein
MSTFFKRHVQVPVLGMLDPHAKTDGIDSSSVDDLIYCTFDTDLTNFIAGNSAKAAFLSLKLILFVIFVEPVKL